MKSKQEQLNRVGNYYRLSKDDEKAGESLSIENQKRMLRKYVEEQGWELIDEYVDDGYTGTNFERPEVQRLLEDAKTGRINTIVVKDLSRFGRNYIEVGQYTDYIFPTYGIRFIAISDNVDTFSRNSTAMDTVVLNDIRSKAKLVIENEERERMEFLQRKAQISEQKINSERKKYKSAKKRLDELEKLIQATYEDKVEGKIPQEVCVRLLDKYLAEQKELQGVVAELETSLSESEQNIIDVDEFIRRLKKYTQAEELTREMCMELIECITVSKFTKDKKNEREIHIYYKFMDKGYAEQLQTNSTH